MITPKFSALNKDGKVKILEPDRFSDYLCSLPEKVYITVGDIKEARKRSSSQNSYYWSVVVHLFSEETGYGKDEAHEQLKSLFLTEKAVINTTNGEKIIDVTKSTQSLNTAQMEEYLGSIREFCAKELSLSIPEPGEVV